MSIAGDVAKWAVSEVVAPDAYSRLANLLGKRSTHRKLYGSVKRSVGYRPGKRYEKWLRAQLTQELPVQRSAAAYAQLVEALGEQLGEDSDRAKPLVDATISYYVRTLEPAMAAHVAEERAAHRYGELSSQSAEIQTTSSEILAHVTADTSFEENLAALPPQARVLLAENSELSSAKALAAAVANGDPNEVITSYSVKKLSGSVTHRL